MMVSRFTMPNRYELGYFKGRPFFRLTCVRGDTPLPGWKPADGIAVHQGWTSEFRPPLHEQVEMHWTIGIPETHIVTPGWGISIPPGLHSVNLGPSPFGFGLMGDKIQFMICTDDPGKEYAELPPVLWPGVSPGVYLGHPDSVDDIWPVAVTQIPAPPGSIIDFDLYWISSGGSDGYAALWANGVQVTQYNGPTLCTKELCVLDPTAPRPYLNHMLYIYGKTDAEAWPAPVTARDIYYLPWAFRP